MSEVMEELVVTVVNGSVNVTSVEWIGKNGHLFNTFNNSFFKL